MKNSHFISSSMGDGLCQFPSVTISLSVFLTHTHRMQEPVRPQD